MQRKQKTINGMWTGLLAGMSMLMGVNTIAEDEPVLCHEILEKARLHIGNGMKPYLPDGIYPEGPMYWDYGTSFQIVLVEALFSALGDDWGLSSNSAFRGSADFYAHATGPSGNTFNFADCSSGTGLALPLFAMARRQHRPELLTGEKARLADVVQRHSIPERRVQFAAPVVTLTDTLSGLKPGTPVWWAMLTGADVRVAGSSATLVKNGKQLQVQFNADGVELAVQSAVHPDGAYNTENPGRSQLLATVCADAVGKARIEVCLALKD